MFITTATAMYILGHGLRTLSAVPRSTQPSTLRGTVKWVSAFGLSNNNKMAMVDVDGSSHLSADSQPKSVGLVWGLAATRRSVCIHQMNRVNSRSDLSRWQHHKHCHWLLLLLLCVCVRARTCEDMCGCIDVARNRESAITVHWSGAKFVTRDGWIS